MLGWSISDFIRKLVHILYRFLVAKLIDIIIVCANSLTTSCTTHMGANYIKQLSLISFTLNGVNVTL